jgi:hypothetical protein
METPVPLFRQYSFWVATVGALINAVPVDLTTFDFTTLNANKVIQSLIFICIFVAARLAKQTPSEKP